jgi:hypothetical protein
MNLNGNLGLDSIEREMYANTFEEYQTYPTKVFTLFTLYKDTPGRWKATKTYERVLKAFGRKELSRIAPDFASRSRRVNQCIVGLCAG